MCGVVAYFGQRSHQARTDFVRLARESKVRGLHAFGAAWYEGDKLKFAKSLNLEGLLVEIPTELPERFIFHNRYSTSGDFRNMVCNQPLLRSDAALVFNGTLDMGTKAEMEARHGVCLVSDNDGELALIKALEGTQAFSDFVKGSRGSFAGAVLSEGRLWVMRNTRRPLWHVNRGTGQFFASTKDIIKRALGCDASSFPMNDLITL